MKKLPRPKTTKPAKGKNRPYMNLSYYQIKECAIESWENPMVLSELYSELTLRTTDFAADLSDKLEARLEELKCFRFPKTDNEIGLGELAIKYREEKGLLQAVGYARGQRAIDMGLNNRSRRLILGEIYTKSIPKYVDIDNVEKRGKPRTSQRLREIVYSIAHFVNQERRNPRGDYSTSISDGKSDLKYLKKAFYDGVYDWIYPKS